MKHISFLALLLIQYSDGLASQSESYKVCSVKNGMTKSLYQKDTGCQTRSTSFERRLHIKKIASFARNTFLPVNFPHKTPTGFVAFSIWSLVQDLSTQLRSIVATQRVLEGVGVGRQDATALSATINFLVRDGCGMASTLIFTSLSSNKFRPDVKRWRLFADMINDLGITLEITATLLPQILFLPMICAGNICKAICGVAAGACNGVIQVHWSKGSDISDINAKFGAQSTVAGSVGLILAAMFARSVSSASSRFLWFIYSSLTILHIVANMKCMKLVAFNYLNTTRMDIAITKFFDSDNEAQAKSIIVTEISKIEPLFFRPIFQRQKVAIHNGVSFDSILESMNGEDIEEAISNLISKKYILALVDREIRIAVMDDATNYDKAKAYFHASVLRRLVVDPPHNASFADLIKIAFDETCIAWPVFEKIVIQSGWDLDRTELGTHGYEISFQ